MTPPSPQGLCLVPPDDDSDEQNAAAQLRKGKAAALLAKIFLLRLLPAFGGDKRGKPEKCPGDGTSAFLRGRPRGAQQPRRKSEGFVLFFFTLGIFQKVSQFALNEMELSVCFFRPTNIRTTATGGKVGEA